MTSREGRRGGVVSWDTSPATGDPPAPGQLGGEGAGGVAAERERERAARMRAGERERSSTVRTIARKHW